VFSPGDTLQITLQLKATGAMPTLAKAQEEVVLRVNIVAEPVTPKPEAAYGLLRAQQVNDQQQVECRRFAWGPEASRIDLICPEDLKAEVVRRRAVFQWTDAVRPGAMHSYAIQKIAQNGSTHFPTFGPTE
jgi:hypothetical protein